MTTARRVSVDMRESTRPFSPENGRGRVDTAKGIIYGVKVLGVRSSNGRRYLPEAIRRAAHLYEGVSVRLDHPDEPEDQRSSESVLGWLRGVKVGPDGSLYADLHYLKSHPFSPRLIEAAQRNSRSYGISHNAQGETETVDGVVVVHEITEVRSCDIVADPATTQGLFEAHRPDRRFDRPATSPRQRRNPDQTDEPTRKRDKPTMKLLEWFNRTRLLPVNRRPIARLFEAGYMDPDMDMPEAGEMPDVSNEPATANPVAEDPADMAPEEALKTGFRAAMVGVIDDNTLDVKAKIGRIKELLQAADRLIGSGQEVPESDDADADDLPGLGKPEGEDEVLEGDDEKKPEDEMLECDGADADMLKAMKESKDPKLVVRAKRQAAALELRSLRREKATRELCESEGFSPAPSVLKALCAMTSDEDRLALIHEVRQGAPSQRKARTAAPAPLTEGRKTGTTNVAPDRVESAEDFLKFITSARAGSVTLSGAN